MLIISEIQSEFSIYQNLQKLRKILSLTIFCITCDFSQFFVILIITKPDRVADLKKFAKIAKNRKFDDFSRYFRFLAVLCHVNVHFSRVHDHLKKAVCRFCQICCESEKFPLYLPFWHFPVSSIKAYLHAKANAASL